jgi:hypothetical protein
MPTVEELIAAALNEVDKGASEASKEAAEKPTPISSEPSSISLAEELEKVANDIQARQEEESKGKEGQLRFHKLAMATILESMDDPKAQPHLANLSKSVVEISKTAFQSPQSDPGTIGELSQQTGGAVQPVVKQKVDKGRTLFQKLKSSDTAPKAEG